MNTVYSRIKKLDLSKWIVTKFYHYTSRAQDIIAEYDEVWHSKPMGDPYIKTVYEHFLRVADSYLNIQYGDSPCDFASLGHQNKTTIEVQNIETGDKLYITQYDGRYYIGKTVWSEFNKYDVFGIKRSTDFTSRDRGHVEEIKRRLHKVERDYDLTLTEEKNWLDNLAERSYK